MSAMLLRCPNCDSVFDAANELAEEIVDANNTVIRHTEERNSWENIAREINSGHGYRVLSLDDIIKFRLKDGTDVAVQVVAIDPYEPNTMAFAFVDALGRHDMNDNGRNTGGWACCGMNEYMNTDIISNLPDELVAVIKERKIVQEIRGEKHTSVCKLWAPSLTEVWGEHGDYTECDIGDVQFPGFDNEKKRVKLAEGETAYYWLRSPYTGYSNYFWFVGSPGSVYYGNALGAYGVVPCFLI